MERSSRLDDLVVFNAVAESGSFTAAAERLGIAKGRASLVVSRLERTLGTGLLSRTTRRVTLTDAGRRLHEASHPLLRGLDDAVASVGTQQESVSGTLRISSSVDHATQNLAAVLAAFSRAHPALHVELRCSDHVVDLVAGGTDVAIRMGWMKDSTLRAVKLGEFEQWLVASPDYLARAPAIRKPADLAHHDWIALTLLPSPLTWTFQSRGGRVVKVRMSTRLRTDSSGALRSLMRSGAGISAVTRMSVADDLQAGSLVRVLPGWSLPRGGIYAVYPPGRHIPASARAFVDFYRSAVIGD